MEFRKLDETKVLKDPVHSYIHINYEVVWQCIDSKEFQRLRRIRQLGGDFQVYPTAEHSRFSHSLGVYEIVRRMVTEIKSLSNELSEYDKVSVMLAGLLHDVGHGPFSHAFEHVTNHSHEDYTVKIILGNTELNAVLSKVSKNLPHDIVAIIQHTHKNDILNQIVSGQLDADRMDYLLRDSYFTATSYGQFDLERILRTMRVRKIDDDKKQLVVKYTGIHSVEDYIMARYQMYWQVYLHKTAVACEKILINILKRAKTLQLNGENLFASPALHYFISNNIDKDWINNKKEETIFWYKQLDDSDIWSAIKVWQGHPDKVLSILSKDLINRETFKVKVYDEPVDRIQLEDIEKKIREKYQLSNEESHYFINYSTIRKDMYSMNDDQIDILYKDGTYKDITQASELFNVELLSKKICKYYLCHQRI